MKKISISELVQRNVEKLVFNGTARATTGDNCHVIDGFIRAYMG